MPKYGLKQIYLQARCVNMYIDFKDPKKVGYKAVENRAKKRKFNSKTVTKKSKKGSLGLSLFGKKKSDSKEKEIEQDESAIEQENLSILELLHSESSEAKAKDSQKIDYEENILDKIYKTINSKQNLNKDENQADSTLEQDKENIDILRQIAAIQTNKQEENNTPQEENNSSNDDKITLITIDEPTNSSNKKPQEASLEDIDLEIPSLITPLNGKSKKIEEEVSADLLPSNKQNELNAPEMSKIEEELEPSNLDDSKTTTPSAPPIIPKVGAAGFIPFEFKGNAKEYFKIWIVNVALSILTLGIYSAWAKVRSNRYLYGNTYLNHSNFEYNADPKRILIGRTIVVFFYGLFLLFAKYLGMLTIASAIAIAFLLILPWLIRQGINFKLKSASYRNIPFKFHAKARNFYAFALVSLLIIAILPIAVVILHKTFPPLAPVVAGVGNLLLFFIIFPLMYRRFKSLVIDNSSYGNARFKFSAKKRNAVGVFFSIFGLTFVVGIVIGIIVGGAGYVLEHYLHINIDFKQIPRTGPIAIALSIGGSILYLALMGLYKGIIDGYLSNFTRNHTYLDEYKFKGEISPLKLGFISATNVILLVLSLGLLYPWTKLRYLRYKIENTYFNCDDYDRFTSSGYDDYNAIGEETMDFFDIDIGI